MSNAKSVTGRIVATKRHGHTYYGNPMMSVQLENEQRDMRLWFRISDNAGIVYGVENAEYRDTPHTFELTRAGRLSGRVELYA